MARPRRSGTQSDQPIPNQEYETIVARVREEMRIEMEQRVAAANEENERRIAQLIADFQAQLQDGNESASQEESSRVRNGGNQNHPHPEDLSVERVWKSINRHHPKTFSERWNPIGAEAWIERLEAIFAAVLCNPYQKARVAILLLEGEALTWWKSVSGDDSLMTWEVFKEKFLGYHFPLSLKKEKESAFYHLKQGDMSVDQFIATFMELTRYVSFLQRQDDPAWRTDQLIEKTRPDLRLQVSGKEFGSFEEACEKLRTTDRLMREAAAMIAKPSGGPGPGHQSQSKPFQPTQSRPSHSLGPTGGVSKKFGSSSGSHSNGSGKKSFSGSFSHGRSGSQGHGHFGNFSRGQFGRSQLGEGCQGPAPWRFGSGNRFGEGSQVTHAESVQSASSVASSCSKCGKYH